MTFFSLLLSGAVCNSKLTLGLPDAPFKSDLVKPDSFSGQVRSLTYNVISKPLYVTTSYNHTALPIPGNLPDED